MTVYNSTIQPNVNNSNVVLAAQPSEMGRRNSITSVEISEEAGRNHKDVMRSIRDMEAAWEQVSGRRFALVDYIDKKGEARPCYQFNYEEFMYVISKFDDITRAKLVTRWAKLETGQAEPMYHQPKQEQLTMKDKMNAATWAAKFLNLNDASKLFACVGRRELFQCFINVLLDINLNIVGIYFSECQKVHRKLHAVCGFNFFFLNFYVKFLAQLNSSFTQKI